MVEVDISDQDYADGKDYTYTTKMDAGEYDVHFEAIVGGGSIETSSSDLEITGSGGNGGNTESGALVPYVVALAMVAIAAGVIMYMKKKKEGEQ